MLDAFAEAVGRIEQARPGTLARALGEGGAAQDEGAAPVREATVAPISPAAALVASAAPTAPGAAAGTGAGLGAAARGAVKVLSRVASWLLEGGTVAIAAPIITVVTALLPTRMGDGTLTGHGMPLGGYPAPPTAGNTMAASSGGPPAPGKPMAAPRSSGADAASLPPNGPEGPDEDWLQSQRYRDANYHGRLAQAGPRGVKSPAPRDGAAALRNSFRISGSAPRRIGVDVANREFVVLDRTAKGQNLWHGHVRSWDGLTQQMRNVLIRNRITNARGKIIAP